MKTKHKQNLLTAALACALTFTTPILAQEAQPSADKTAEAKPATGLGSSEATDADPWRFDLDIIGWGPAVSGDVTVHGQKVNVDESLDDLLHDLKGIAMLGFELRKEKFGFYAQPNWIKLEEDAKVGPLNGTLEQELWIVDAAGFYQLHKWGEETPVTLDALAGVRYWHINNELTLDGSGGGSQSAYLIDPIVGLRAKIYFTPKFSLSLHGDIGGFDASDNSSDLSWQALGTLNYDFTRHFSLALGYRAMSVDKDSGSGSNAKGLDIILHGFLLALDFHW
jgi:opacity protein-like surface antigen